MNLLLSHMTCKTTIFTLNETREDSLDLFNHSHLHSDDVSCPHYVIHGVNQSRY